MAILVLNCTELEQLVCQRTLHDPEASVMLGGIEQFLQTLYRVARSIYIDGLCTRLLRLLLTEPNLSIKERCQRLACSRSTYDRKYSQLWEPLQAYLQSYAYQPLLPVIERSPMIGRDADMHHLQTAIAKYPCVVLSGMAGLGKTRLVLDLAHHLTGQRFYCSLDGATTYNEIVRRLYLYLAQVHHPLHIPSSTVYFEGQIGDVLENIEEGYLILDQCDQCSDADLWAVMTMLQQRTAVQYIVIRRLPPPDPWRLPITWYHFPLQGLASHAALSLFQQRLNRRLPMTKKAIAERERLLRLTHGNPYIIEMLVEHIRATDRSLSAICDNLSEPMMLSPLDSIYGYMYTTISAPAREVLCHISLLDTSFRAGDLVSLIPAFNTPVSKELCRTGFLRYNAMQDLYSVEPLVRNWIRYQWQQHNPHTMQRTILAHCWYWLAWTRTLVINWRRDCRYVQRTTGSFITPMAFLYQYPPHDSTIRFLLSQLIRIDRILCFRWIRILMQIWFPLGIDDTWIKTMFLQHYDTLTPDEQTYFSFFSVEGR